MKSNKNITVTQYGNFIKALSGRASSFAVSVLRMVWGGRPPMLHTELFELRDGGGKGRAILGLAKNQEKDVYELELFLENDVFDAVDGRLSLNGEKASYTWEWISAQLPENLSEAVVHWKNSKEQFGLVWHPIGALHSTFQESK